VSEPLEQVLDRCDVSVIVTVHPGLEMDVLLERAPLVVDFRGATTDIAAANLVRL
jgi:hypothetical protein